MTISRRDFFRLGGSAGVAVAMGNMLSQSLASAAAISGKQAGVLIDITKCVGCRKCEGACKAKNGLPADAANAAQPAKLSATKFTYVDKLTVTTATVNKGTRTIKRQCMHCLEPACASACPVAALYKVPDGPVIYRAERCLGCRYCMVACPFDVPKYEWESTSPVIRKCQGCFDLTACGDSPACCSACPTGALKYGVRDDLLVEAKQRIKDNPTKYVNHVYGENEVGGTAVLYLADVPFEKLGLRTDLPTQALPHYTDAAMSKIPGLVMGLAVVLGSATVLSGRQGSGEKPAERALDEEGK